MKFFPTNNLEATMLIKKATILFILAIFLLGCTGSKNGEVSGIVTYDGKSIEHGSIVFLSTDGKGPTSGGMIDKGKYFVQNVPVGSAKVLIKAPKESKKMKMYDDPKADWVMQAGEELLPPIYSNENSTELKLEIKSGKNEKDFILSK